MKDTHGSEDWRILCELASKEQDPDKLIDLITKIDQALEEFHQKSRHPLNANAYLYRIAPLRSQPIQYESRNLRLDLAFSSSPQNLYAILRIPTTR